MLKDCYDVVLLCNYLRLLSSFQVTTEHMLEHINKLMDIPGAHLAYGGKPLDGHNIPKVYGAMEPTAVFVPLKEMLKSKENFALATTEIFGPFQVSLRCHLCSMIC
jgi:1-pyrroline-5-carboxylate dehydrogenase